jgi:hypothetical protein
VVTPLPDGTAQVAWRTDQPADSLVRFGSSADNLNGVRIDPALVQDHRVVVTGLQPSQTYWVGTTSTDAAGNAATGSTVQFTTPGTGVAEQTAASFRRGSTTGQAAIGTSGFGSVTLADDASGTNGKRRSGSFDSGVVDAQAMVDWDRVMLRADVPSGCTLTVRVRTGSTAVPDGSWSSWRTVADGDRVGKGSRYIQYRVELTSQARTGTPSLFGIGFVNNGTPLATATETR